MDDFEALRRFAEMGDEKAFGEVVGRHVDVVYAAARRQLRGEGGGTGGAEDVTQGVFLLLAKKARGFGRAESGRLTGWLLKATYFACRGVMRAEARRRFYERKAMRMRTTTVEDAGTRGEEIELALDGALMGLSEMDRAAVGMRCLEEWTFAEVGSALGISEEAARKRVDRAIEKLRVLLARRGVVAPTGLAGVLAAKGVEKAPASVVAGIGVGAGMGGKAAVIAKMAGKLLLWGEMKTAAVVGSVMVVTGVLAAVTVVQMRASAVATSGPSVSRGATTIVLAATAADQPRGVFGAERVGDRMVFSGRVVDEEGKPVSGVAYKVFDYHSPSDAAMEKEGKTELDGGFTTGPVVPGPPGTLGREILFDAPGYAYAWWSPISNEAVWMPRQVVVRKGMVVSGVVRDLEGRPVEGAEVNGYLQSQEYGYCGMDAEKGLTVKTDAAGRFVFERIPADARMHVTARAAGHATASTWDGEGYRDAQYPVTAGTTDVELTMGREAVVHGQLMHDGKPVAKGGLVITAWEQDRKMWWSEAKTDAQGKVELRGLGAGTWSLGPSEEDTTEEALHVQGSVVKLAAGDVRELALSYDEGVLLRGTVHDGAGHGEPMPVYVRADGAFMAREVMPDASGKFETRVLPGKYTFTAYGWSAGKFKETVQEVEVGEKMGPVELVAEERQKVKGQLVDEAGKGVKGMLGFAMNRCVYTDDAGRFEIAAPDPQESLGVAVDASGKLGVGFQYDATDMGELRLVLEPMGAITGRVVDGAGHGIGDARVFVEANGGGLELEGGKWVWGITVESDGTYRIAPVPTGYSLQVFADRDEWQGNAKVQSLDAGEEKTLDVVIRSRGATTRGAKHAKEVVPPGEKRDAKITGRLVDAQGEALVGWRISWSYFNDDKDTGTDLKGRFVLEGLPAGKKVTVRVDREGKRQQWEVETGTEGVELKMEK